MEFISLNSVDSTSTFARNNISKYSIPFLVTARVQTNGRGRNGKSFFSPEDRGLYMSLVFKENKEFDLVTPAAAVAVCEILERNFGIYPQIKWVNDLEINSKKFCGILTERIIFEGDPYICLGIGINLNGDVFPESINATSLEINADTHLLSKEISEAVMSLNDRYDKSIVLSKYRARLGTIGKQVEYYKNNVYNTGMVQDIDDDCHLIIVKEDGSEDLLSSGEISIKVRKENV